jgi:hypothetical protein
MIAFRERDSISPIPNLSHLGLETIAAPIAKAIGIRHYCFEIRSAIKHVETIKRMAGVLAFSQRA